MRLLLDTNIVIRAATVGVEELSPATRALITHEDTDRFISSISITEIAIKSSIGKLAISEAQLGDALQDLGIAILSYSPAHARRLFVLPLLDDHRDPFDRMLVATALSEGVPVVTTDRAFRRYKGLKVLS